MRPLELDEVLRLREDGAQLLDVREAAEYAKGHLAGSLNIGLGGQYATWAGTVLDRCAADRDRGGAGARAGGGAAAGTDRVRPGDGLSAGGHGGAGGRPELVAATERVSPGMLAEELAAWRSAAGARYTRAGGVEGEASERECECSADATAAAWGRFRGKEIAVHCAGGYRSSLAVGILKQHGVRDVIELAGGITAWETAGLGVVTG